VVRRQLLGTKGVADVSSFGGKLKQYEIAINPNKLQAFNININDVFTALESNNQNTGGAYIEKKKRSFLSEVKDFGQYRRHRKHSGS
jgi:cobalt-zinc-cadmium resistance protein CzcA